MSIMNFDHIYPPLPSLVPKALMLIPFFFPTGLLLCTYLRVLGQGDEEEKEREDNGKEGERKRPRRRNKKRREGRERKKEGRGEGGGGRDRIFIRVSYRSVAWRGALTGACTPYQNSPSASVMTPFPSRQLLVFDKPPH